MHPENCDLGMRRMRQSDSFLRCIHGLLEGVRYEAELSQRECVADDAGLTLSLTLA